MIDEHGLNLATNPGEFLGKPDFCGYSLRLSQVGLNCQVLECIDVMSVQECRFQPFQEKGEICLCVLAVDSRNESLFFLNKRLVKVDNDLVLPTQTIGPLAGEIAMRPSKTQMTCSAKLSLVVLALACLTQTGCLLNHSNHMVVRQDEPLRPLTFESEDTRMVYERTAKSAIEDDSNESSASFGIPFIVGLERTKSLSGNAIRNDVATRLDINSDNHISNYEASLVQGKR